jgi:arabinogalactan oligomer/maltooligosaccharide transport system permease protein
MTSLTAARPAKVKTRKWTPSRGAGARLTMRRQIVLQLLCLFVTLTVLFPILYIVGLAIDPRNLSRPDSLIPPGASLDAFARVIAHPTQLDPISFMDLAINSFKLAAMTSLATVLIGVTAAYAFSRLKFRFREVLMISILGVLMLPAVATIAPLFIFLNGIHVDLPILGTFNLRQSLLGVGLAVISGALPFAIWNLKGYLDTIPKDLEEAAAVDGASQNQTFLRVVLPLAMPAIAVTAFLGFLAGWTEFYFVSTFLRDPKDYTLAYELNKMVGAFGQTPWSDFAAFAILFSLPVSAVFFFFQRYIVGGLAIGGVKG